MIVVRRIAFSLLLISGLYLGSRLLMAKSPTDAFRAFGVSFAFLILVQWPLAVEGSVWREKFDKRLDSLLGLNFLKVFLGVFFWLLATHAIQGWGVHSWQGFDIGFFVQATFNAFSEKGLMFKNIDGDLSFFAHHFSPFLFLLAPLGTLREAPIWLYTAQDAVLAASFALLFGRIARLPNVHRYAKAGMALALFTHPFWFGLKYYEFHELSFAPLPMFFLLVGWERKNPWMVLAAALSLMCIKETSFFSLAWFGCVLLVTSREAKLKVCGTAVLTLAVCFWFFYFKGILPAIAGRSESMFLQYYGHLGNSMLEVALSPVQRPFDFLKAIFSASNAFYLLAMFAFCFPFLNKPRHWMWIIPVLPDFAVALLSRYAGIRNAGHQYAGLVIVPVLFVVMSGYASWDQWSSGRKKWTTAWLLLVAASAISTNPINIWKTTFWGPASAHASRGFVEGLRAVPKSESIVVTAGPLLPFAAQRDNLIWIPNATDDTKLPSSAKWAAFKVQQMPSWMDHCSTERIDWQGYLLCRLK